MTEEMPPSRVIGAGPMDAIIRQSWQRHHDAAWHAAVSANAMHRNNALLLLARSAWNPEHDLPVEEQRLITPQEFRSSPGVILVDSRLLRVLDQRPEQILSLSAREFEEFVASLLERLGYHAAVTPVGRDGGIDISAHRTTDIGTELVLVQCKRYGPTKKVDEPTVKQLCTVVDDHKATRGLIVTSSTFTSVALRYIEAKRYRVSGADLSKLQEWMRLARAGTEGR
jgi:HJR/Mrr/RecB family endonuclease